MTNWTTERPKKPGDYWFSLPVANRVLFASPDVVRCVVFASECALPSLHVSWMDADGCCRILSLQKDKLDGALWAERTTPEDPFAKPSEMRTDQEGREYNHDDRDCRYSTEVGSNCHLFGKARQRRNSGCGFYFDRLPECIAAEKAGKP